MRDASQLSMQPQSLGFGGLAQQACLCTALLIAASLHPPFVVSTHVAA